MAWTLKSEKPKPSPPAHFKTVTQSRMQALHPHKLLQLRGLPARTSLHPLRKSPDSCSSICLRPTAQSHSECYQEPEDTVNRSTLLRQSAILAAGSATMGTGTSSAHAQPSPLQPTQDFQVMQLAGADMSECPQRIVLPLEPPACTARAMLFASDCDEHQTCCSDVPAVASSTGFATCAL